MRNYCKCHIIPQPFTIANSSQNLSYASLLNRKFCLISGEMSWENDNFRVTNFPQPKYLISFLLGLFEPKRLKILVILKITDWDKKGEAQRKKSNFSQENKLKVYFKAAIIIFKMYETKGKFPKKFFNHKRNGTALHQA